MALGDNSVLVRDAVVTNVANNGTNDPILSQNGADAFKFTNGSTGDDTIAQFDKNDSIVNYKMIFDGNNDGIIEFGAQSILDIDRTSRTNPGSDQIVLQQDGVPLAALRYLGSKSGANSGDAQGYVYADASVRLTGFTEGTVGDNTYADSNGAKKYFYDTALGLNLGGDTINGFGSDDQIVTTSRIYNGPKGDDAGTQITFGKNGVLDLSGEFINSKGDDGVNNGGQIDLVGVSGLYLQETNVVNGVTYYHYGIENPMS